MQIFEKQRAGNRLRWSLPVLLDSNATIYTASTQDLSAQGARLKAPVALPPGALVAVTNLQTGQRARFEVVWRCEQRGSDDCFSLGLRMVEPSDAFWGFAWSSSPKPLGSAKPREPLATQTLSWRKT